MASEFIAEAGKLLASAVFGGLITAATAVPYFNNKLTALTVELSSMKSECTTCRSNVHKSLDNISESVNLHHIDADRHNTKASEKLLQDIYDRIVRIEGKIFNGGSR